MAQTLCRSVAKRVLMPWDKMLDAWCGIGAEAGGIAGGLVGAVVFGVVATDFSEKRGFEQYSYQDCLMKVGGMSFGGVMGVIAGVQIGALSPVWMSGIAAYFLVNGVIGEVSPTASPAAPPPEKLS